VRGGADDSTMGGALGCTGVTTGGSAGIARVAALARALAVGGGVFGVPRTAAA
jgi:hypothetical protein